MHDDAPESSWDGSQIDPVCGETIVREEDAIASCEHDDRTFHFLHIRCKMLFEQDPAKYLEGGPQPTAPQGQGDASAALPTADTPGEGIGSNPGGVRMRVAAALSVGALAVVGSVIGVIASGNDETVTEPRQGTSSEVKRVEGQQAVAASDGHPAAADDAVPVHADEPAQQDTPPSVADPVQTVSVPEAREAQPQNRASEGPAAAQAPGPVAPRQPKPSTSPAPAVQQAKTARATTPKPKRASKPTRSATERARLQYRLGSDYLKDGNLQAATACFKKSVELDPKYAEAFAALGLTYARQKMHEDAVTAWTTYLSLAPNARDKDDVSQMIREYTANP